MFIVFDIVRIVYTCVFMICSTTYRLWAILMDQRNVCMYVCMYVRMYVYVFLFFIYLSMLHYLCNTTCYNYLHFTFCTLYTYVCICVCMYVCIHVCMYVCMYVKVIPQQAEVALEVTGRLRPGIFLTFGTTTVVGRQPYASMYVGTYVYMYACMYVSMLIFWRYLDQFSAGMTAILFQKVRGFSTH